MEQSAYAAEGEEKAGGEGLRRLLPGGVDVQGQEAVMPSPSSCLAPPPRPDQGRPSGQPQERKQEGQQAGESRAGDGLREYAARTPDRVASAVWPEESTGISHERPSRGDPQNIRGGLDHSGPTRQGLRRVSANHIEDGPRGDVDKTGRSDRRPHPSSPAPQPSPQRQRAISLCIIGCETGPRRRPCKLEWVESIVQQCQDAGVPVFVKALDLGGRVSKDMAEWPEWARRREEPVAAERTAALKGEGS